MAYKEPKTMISYHVSFTKLPLRAQISHFPMEVLKESFESGVVYAKQWKDKMEEHGADYTSDLAVLQVLNGNKEAGEIFLKKNKPDNTDYDFGNWEYNRAKVLLALGKEDEAMEFLKLANELGHWFTWYYYENDIFFKDLLDNEDFQEFVKVKE